MYAKLIWVIFPKDSTGMEKIYCIEVPVIVNE